MAENTRDNKGYVPHRLFGRKALMSSYTEINESNIEKAFAEIRSDFEANSMQCETLWKYYRGDQNILYRTKTKRPEICNRAVVNCPLEIVNFKSGYSFGEPVQYVCRASGEDEGISQRVADLNEFMYGAGKFGLDKELGDWLFTCGTAYRMIMSGDDIQPFRIDTLDPRNTGVAYSADFGRAPVMAIQRKRDENGDTVFWCWTADYVYKLSGGLLVSKEPHAMGFIPIFEYTTGNARLGAFEPAMGLIDALNIIENNRVDGVEQFVQFFMKCVNVKLDPEQYAELRDAGLMSFTSDPGNPGDVNPVTVELDQSQTQVLADDIYQQILIKCDMPDRNGSNRTTGDTGQAVILRDGWSAAESYARSIEMFFKPVEQRFIGAALRLCAMRGYDLGLKVSDIGIKFTRNMTDNLLTKTQGLQNELEAGIHPRICIANCGLFSDPEQVYLDSIEYLKKWLPGANQPEVEVTPANNKPNPEDE